MAHDPRSLLRHEGGPDDLERDLHTEHQILNMGPSHPATHGTVKFLIELDGETIVDLDIQVGYLHRGFEKECESGTWYQAIPYTDRLNYNSAILCNLGFCTGWRSSAGSRRRSAACGCACSRPSSPGSATT
jgi:NADH:ubiquinone oxidoreductase subunit D